MLKLPEPHSGHAPEEMQAQVCTCVAQLHTYKIMACQGLSISWYLKSLCCHMRILPVYMQTDTDTHIHCNYCKVNEGLKLIESVS